MDIRIGIVNAAREVTLELDDDQSIDDIKSAVDAAVAAGDGLVWLTDRKGNQTGFPASKLAYIEIGESEGQRIGFS